MKKEAIKELIEVGSEKITKGETMSEVKGETMSEVKGETMSEVKGETMSEVKGETMSEVKGETMSEVKAMSVNNLEAVIASASDLSAIILQIKEELYSVTPKDIKFLAEELVVNGVIAKGLSYPKKLVLSEYFSLILRNVEKNIKQNKKLKSGINATLRPLIFLANNSEWLIDLTFHTFEKSEEREMLIKSCVTTTKERKNFDISYSKISSVVYTDLSGYSIKFQNLFTKSALKDLKNSRNADGGAVYSATSLTAHIKKELEANKVVNESLFEEAKKTFEEAKKTLTA